MKNINYILACAVALSLAGCSSHSHEHDHEHSHSNEQAEHVHSHGEHADCEHAGHDHGHSHEQAGHTHSHGEKVDSHSENQSDIITFGKQQRDKIDFAVAKVARSTFNGAVKVAARVVPVPDNVTTVVAASAGRVRYAGNLVQGKTVSSGDALFVLDGGNVTDNDAAVKFAEAESRWEVAKADFERKQALYKENIVSQKDLQESQAALRSAEAHYRSMQRSFNGNGMAVKATIGGYVASLLVANGDYVEPGTPLAVLQRDGDVNIEAELPVRYARMLTGISSVNITLNDGTSFSLDDADGRVVAVGRSVNKCNMIPVTVAVKPVAGIVPGSVVTMHIASSLPESSAMLAVPRTALVEEMGNYYVFVQRGNDKFEKREVQTGLTDGITTQILKGLHDGETVVTKGAVSLKLSQGAAAIDPHAGHAH